jgi:hypothetical protein
MKTYKIRNKADGGILEVTEDQLAEFGLQVPNQMAKGGMIKRADGSYSRRGLWDNIRANKGSGKKPTKAMLEQEKKIRAAEKAYGGYMDMGGYMNPYMGYGGMYDMGGMYPMDMMAQGGINNPGFRALPDYVQQNIIDNMAYGGCKECGGKMQDGGRKTLYQQYLEKYPYRPSSDTLPFIQKSSTNTITDWNPVQFPSTYGYLRTQDGITRTPEESERISDWRKATKQKFPTTEDYFKAGQKYDSIQPKPFPPYDYPVPIMKTGGKLPKEVLRARLESHMSSGQAQNYLDKYQKGGKVKSKKALDEAMNEIASDFNRRLERNAMNNAIDSMYGPAPQIMPPTPTKLPYYPDPNKSLDQLLTPLPYRPNLNESMEEMMIPYAEGGYFDEAGDGKWIQKATASIKKRGTEGVCTGSKFGGPGCPPGSKRYNLAKTFRKMAKSKKEEGGYAQGGEYEMTDAEIAKLRSMGYKIKEV